MAKPSFQSWLTLIMFAALCAIGYLYFTGQLVPKPDPLVQNPDDGAGILKTENDFRDRLEGLRMQREKVARNVKRLEKLKNDTLDHLKQKGIKSGIDFQKSDDPDVKLNVRNLQEGIVQIRKLKSEIGHYDEAVSAVGVMLDRLERERVNEEVALSDEESFELRKIIIDLNERLKVDTDVLEDDELSQMLDQEMGTSETDTDSE